MLSMTCGACGAVNLDGRKFCGQCGALLSRACPSCGSANPPLDRFCGECGTALEAAGESPTRTASGADLPLTERRLVSVLFVDLVGFTTISEQRDAEDMRSLLSAYFESARAIIERCGLGKAERSGTPRKCCIAISAVLLARKGKAPVNMWA